MTRNAQGQLEGRGEWFFYAPGVDNLLASWNYYEVNPSPRHLFFRDWRGSVVQVTNEHGTALGLSPDTYAAFGAPGGTMTPDKERGPGYNGHESAGGLVYMRNRWYDPNTGRFTQEDPIGFAGGSNLYAYVGNNPVSFSDPFGLKVCFRGASKDADECDDEDAKRLWDETYAAGNDSVKAQMDALVNAEATFGLVFGSVPPGHAYGSSGPSSEFDGGAFTIDTRSINSNLQYADARFVLGHEIGHAQPRSHSHIINVFENSVRAGLGFHARDAIRENVPQPLNKWGRRFP